MNTVPIDMTTSLVKPGFLAKERIIAPPSFNRWLVPPAALAIHLCIGMAYGFSVFWLPLSKAIGINEAVACGPEIGFLQELTVTHCDWKISTLGWMYTLFFVFLGSSAALWGGWLEHVGPRKAAVVSAFCWCGGMLLSALGILLPSILADALRLWRNRRHWLGPGVISRRYRPSSNGFQTVGVWRLAWQLWVLVVVP